MLYRLDNEYFIIFILRSSNSKNYQSKSLTIRINIMQKEYNMRIFSP